MKRASPGIDRVEVVLDVPSLVANTGLIVLGTLMLGFGLEVLVNQTIRPAGIVGGSGPGRKVCTLVTAMLAGARHIDHANVLRAGVTGKVLPFRVMAPSTLGTFLRGLHLRARPPVGPGDRRDDRPGLGVGAGPGGEPLVIDMDSTVCEVHGKAKQSAAFGYTHELGYHPLLASRADTGEVLHARLRKGSSQRGHTRFVEEFIAGVRRAGATDALCLRADSGFWSHTLIDTLGRPGVGWSITVTINKTIRAAIDTIDTDAWEPIVPNAGEAAVGETTYTCGRGHHQRSHRLVDPAQLAMWPHWRHHAFITSSTADAVTADRFHRDHATVELAIRDLKAGAGMDHCPSGRFCVGLSDLVCNWA